MTYSFEIEIDGNIHAMTVDKAPTSLVLRLIEFGEPVRTILAEKVVI